MKKQRGPTFNQFLVKNIIRALVYFAIIFGIYWIFKNYISEGWQEWIEPLTSKPLLMYLIFFASETFFGIFPPEFFVIWAASLGDRLLMFVIMVFLLSIISFSGATIAFYVGTRINRSTLYLKLIQSRWREYFKIYRRFGGIVIILSALTPLPYATISLISGAVGFNYKRDFLFASSRFLRFLIYGWIFWQG